PVPVWDRAPGGQDARRVEHVLDAIGDAVEQATIPARGEGPIRLVRLFAGQLLGDRDVTEELGGDALDAPEIDVGEAATGDLAGEDPVGLRPNRGKGDIVLVLGQ